MLEHTGTPLTKKVFVEKSETDSNNQRERERERERELSRRQEQHRAFTITWHSSFSMALLRQRALSRRRELGAPLPSSACSLSFHPGWFREEQRADRERSGEGNEGGRPRQVGVRVHAGGGSLIHHC